MKTSLISAAIHVSLVGLYMMFAPARTDARPRPERPDIVIYRPPPLPPSDPGSAHPGNGGPGIPEHWVTVPREVPPNIPPIDVHPPGAPTVTMDTTWEIGSRASGSRGSGGGQPSSSGGVLSADVVDVQVTPYAGAPTPRYPESLRAAGVEGEVTLEFVVDTAGRVERGSVHTISSTAEAFVVSVSEALNATRYHPALVGGRHVRQLVRQQFVFSLTQH